jgi:hypothetical protein
VTADLAVLPAPPTDWMLLASPHFYGVVRDVMTNYDHHMFGDVAAQLAAGGCIGAHSAWEFNGLVWFWGGRWHERVSVLGRPRAVFSAPTLTELMKAVNDQFGWY